MCWLLYNTVVQLLSAQWGVRCVYISLKPFLSNPVLGFLTSPIALKQQFLSPVFLIVALTYDCSDDISQTLVRELIDIYLWLYSVLLTLSDPIVFFWCAAGLYLHSVTRCKASCCPRGWAGPSPLIRLNRCDSITPLEPHRKISLTLRTADVSDAWFVRVLLTLAIC